MPYKIVKTTGTKPYKIVKTATGKVVGSSTTRQAAQLSIKARYAGEKKKKKNV